MNILFAALAMFALTIFAQLRLGAVRFNAMRDGRIDPKFFRTYEGYEEPETLRVHSRHLVNLYEAPTLFYVIVVIAFVTGQSGLLPVVLAWTYVALRAVHSYVHLTSNNVRRRFRLFLASLVVLVTLWFTVFVGMLLTAPAR